MDLWPALWVKEKFPPVDPKRALKPVASEVKVADKIPTIRALLLLLVFGIWQAHTPPLPMDHCLIQFVMIIFEE